MQKLNIEKLKRADQWILKRFNTVVKKVNENFEIYKFGNAVEEISKFYVRDFCDFYLEYSKSVDNNKDVLFFIIDNFLRLLHPFMPFLSEELYQKLDMFEGKNETICLADYPKFVKDFDNFDNSFEETILLVK